MESYVCSDELYHYGILGMKWGVRRYQNKDGSLTAKGKKRYGSDEAEEKKEETVEERRARVLNSTDAREIYKNKYILTTNELNERINRIDTEARLKSKIVEEPKKSTMYYVNKALSTYKKVDEVYSTVRNSTVGKMLAKKLGLEPEKKEFNLDEFWKNRNKKTTQEILDVNKRLTAEESIKKKMDERSAAKESTKGKEQKTETYSGAVEDGPTQRKTSGSSWKSKSDIFDAEWKDVSDDTVSTGQSYVVTLLEDKNKK